MSGILLVFQFVLAILLVILVLMQKSSGGGLGTYSGSNESLFGARGPAGFLAKATFVLGFVFVCNTIALGYFYGKEAKKSIIDDVKIESSVPAAPFESNAPAAPILPQNPFNEAPAAPIAPAQNTIESAPNTENTAPIESNTAPAAPAAAQ